MKKRLTTLILALLMIVGAWGVCATAEVVPFPEAPVIGIAWRADTDSEFFTNICRAVEEAGGTWVLLDQVTSADLAYDDAGKLTEGVTALGSLDGDAAKYVRLNTWHGSNAAEAVGDVSIVLFTGGEDISSTLFFEPEPWHGIVAEIDYNAERDVSDYLTMSYCLDNDIPVMGFCRGMQMLGVISGAEMIQDIPARFAELGVEYDDTHRNQKATPEAYRDYAAHDVEVAEGSRLHDIVGGTTLTGCPSWHHQAIGNVDNTRLIVTGTTDGQDLRRGAAIPPGGRAGEAPGRGGEPGGLHGLRYRAGVLQGHRRSPARAVGSRLRGAVNRRKRL